VGFLQCSRYTSNSRPTSVPYVVNQFLADLLSRRPQLRLVAQPHGRGHPGWIDRRKGGLLARGGRSWMHLLAIRL
jgi:hypothetical protein